MSLPQTWWWWHLDTVFFPFPFPVFPQSGLQKTQGPLRFICFLIGTSWEGVNKMPVYFRWGTDNRLKWFHSSLAGWSSEFIGVTYRAWVRIERLMGDSKTTVSSKSPSQQGWQLRQSTYLEFPVQLPYGLCPQQLYFFYTLVEGSQESCRFQIHSQPCMFYFTPIL